MSASLNEKIEVIESCLGDILTQKEIISRYELLQRVYQCVREADLSSEERSELEEMVGEKNVAAGIFHNVLGKDPIFTNIPKLDSAMQVNDVMFHFVHTGNYGDPEFAKAFSKYQKAEEELKALSSLNLKDLLVEFMDGAGYVLKEDNSGKLTFANSNDERLDFRIFASIQEVEIVDGMKGSVAIAPHGESPGPFIDFFHEKGIEADKSEVKVWVANMEAGTIDPFIGYPKDMEIYKQFSNPRLALMVKDHWGRRME